MAGLGNTLGRVSLVDPGPDLVDFHSRLRYTNPRAHLRTAILGQPFEQDADAVRRGQEGLGVGRAFVLYVAQVHGGWTHVESLGPDQGSTFSLILPPAAALDTDR
jgi:hypothetical protein